MNKLRTIVAAPLPGAVQEYDKRVGFCIVIIPGIQDTVSKSLTVFLKYFLLVFIQILRIATDNHEQ